MQKLKKKKKTTISVKKESRGSFCRRFALPDTANCDELTAKFEAGVLEITIPKQAVEAEKKIKIQ